MNSDFAELIGLEAQARADLNVGLRLLDGIDGLGDPSDVPLAGSATAGHQADRFAPACAARYAACAASAGLAQEYFRISAVEPSRCEQYVQSSGHRPLFMLMIVLRFTRSPKKCRTRPAAATRSRVCTSSVSTASA
jgi:hypothetical protein